MTTLTEKAYNDEIRNIALQTYNTEEPSGAVHSMLETHEYVIYPHMQMQALPFTDTDAVHEIYEKIQVTEIHKYLALVIYHGMTSDVEQYLQSQYGLLKFYAKGSFSRFLTSVLDSDMMPEVRVFAESYDIDEFSPNAVQDLFVALGGDLDK